VLNLRMHNLFLGVSIGLFAYYNRQNQNKLEKNALAVQQVRNISE
jgi:hypothetical protein